MPRVTLKYLHSKPYSRYINNDTRPDAELPWVDFTESSRFNTPHGLKVHYRDIHKLSVVIRRTGSLNYQEDQQALEWYTDLFGETPSRSPFWQDEAAERSNGNNTVADGEFAHRTGEKSVYRIEHEYPIQPLGRLDQSQSLPCGKVSPDQAGDRPSDHDEDSTNNENNEQVDPVEAKSDAGVYKGKESKMIADLHAELEKFI
ncbi:hypothetical protein NW762_007714 [Fusarium torreyae]|uniref:Uncharacterized protein n=1 Tax=Fusarium torreyae TaxID=1237075 RepID=A0A9W8RZU8_9HYPO|nr:hypothetical protein NW762_007714 [Fusarium torreyae]